MATAQKRWLTQPNSKVGKVPDLAVWLPFLPSSARLSLTDRAVDRAPR